jgi:hypothetical protein
MLDGLGTACLRVSRNFSIHWSATEVARIDFSHATQPAYSHPFRWHRDEHERVVGAIVREQ